MPKKTSMKFRNAKILVADDCDFNREILVEFLNLMDIQSECAEDGVEAIDKAKKGRYDAILMDIQMPNKDGITATIELKQLQIPLPPIIAVTANALPEEKKRCLDSGMNDYITKPISLASLEEVLAKYLKDKIVQSTLPGNEQP